MNSDIECCGEIGVGGTIDAIAGCSGGGYMVGETKV
jgi:hypothetical protein